MSYPKNILITTTDFYFSFTTMLLYTQQKMELRISEFCSVSPFKLLDVNTKKIENINKKLLEIEEIETPKKKDLIYIIEQCTYVAQNILALAALCDVILKEEKHSYENFTHNS